MPHPRFQLAPLTLATALALTSLAVAAPPAHAQAATAAVPISLPAQSLGTALNELARQAKLQLMVHPDLVAGKQAPAVSGNLTARQALDRLLAGSGLEAQIRGSEVIVRQAPPAPVSVAPTLAEVLVTAQAERDELTEGTGSYTTGSTRAATGMNLSLRETPQSVSVITQQRMQDQQLNSLTEVLEQTIGVTAQVHGTAIGGYNNIFSRGYMVGNYQVDGVSISSYSFGADTNRISSGLDTAIYDSVAVVRGATGLMTGAGDPSASVNLVRKRPTKEFQASVEGSVGRWNSYRGVADVSGALNSTGSVRARLVAAYDDAESWISRYKGERSTIYGITEIDLTDRTLLGFSVEHGRAKSNATQGGWGWQRLYPGTGNPTPFGRHDSGIVDWGLNDDKRTTYSAEVAHRFNEDWSGKLSYSHTDRDFDGKRTASYLIGSNNMAETWGGGSSRSAHKEKVNSVNAKIDGKYALFGRQHDLAIGFNYSESGNSTRPYYSANAGGVQFPVINGVPQWPEPDWNARVDTSGRYTSRNLKTSGLYASTRFRATDDLSLILGARLSNWQSQTRAMPAGTFSDNGKYSNELTPYAGVTYDLNKNVTTYASYTKIFSPQSVKDANDKLLDPESGYNIEIGAKGEWFDGRLNGSLALFQSGKDNLAVFTNQYHPETGNAIYRAENNTKGRGFEIEVSGRPYPGLNLQAGFTHFKLENIRGEQLNAENVPLNAFKLYGTYTPSALPRLTVGAGLNWQSKIFARGNKYEDFLTQKAYSVANAMVSYRFNKNLDLLVNINNIFNRQYLTQVFIHNYGAERNVRATLKYRF